jgi:hypothetical protein
MTGAAVPAFAFPGQALTAVAPAIGASWSVRSGDKLVVSGRIVDARGAAVAGAAVEAWHEDVHRTSVVTDADGRFMFTTTTPRSRSALSYRVTQHGRAGAVRELHLARRSGVADGHVARLQRDDTGVWRTTMGLTLA